MTEYRFYAKEDNDLTVILEPWGTEYIVPPSAYLKVATIGDSDLVEFRCSEKTMAVYFNGPEIDEEKTFIILNSRDTILN